MPDPDRRLTHQGIERKQQLLDAAARLFADRGYAETRIVDICREAGVAKGLFYWYFETKEAVFLDLADELRRGLRREQGRAMDPDADPLVQIRQGAEASVRFMVAHARAFALLNPDKVDERFAPSLREGTAIHADDSEALIRRGIDAGLVCDEHPRALAYSVLSTVGAFTALHRSGALDLSVDELAAFVGRLVVRSLAVDPTAAEVPLPPAARTAAPVQ